MAHSPEVTKKLKQLEEKFKEKLSATRRDIQHFQNPVDFDALLGIIHKLSGSAGTFGFHDLSTQMRELETRMRKTSIQDLNIDVFTGFKNEATAIIEVTLETPN